MVFCNVFVVESCLVQGGESLASLSLSVQRLASSVMLHSDRRLLALGRP